MQADKQLEALTSNNPFASSSVGDPWESRYPDVPSVNGQAFEGLSRLIRQKTRDPSLSCAGLIFGEIGSGKTHLIGRILSQGKNSRFPYTIAYIQPIEDPRQTFRYLLREVMVNLCYPVDGQAPYTQLDRILERIEADLRADSQAPAAQESSFKDLWAQLRSLLGRKKTLAEKFKGLLGLLMEAGMGAREKGGAAVDRVDFIRAKFPQIPTMFLRVLFQYPDPQKRPAAVDWLKGIAIDPEDAEILGVPAQDEEDGSLEQQAKNILHSLGLLLAEYGQPLAVCFDRLENYDSDERIAAFGRMAEFLVDVVPAMLPLVFVRGQQWEERFSTRLNQQVITRLHTNTFMLRGCDQAQALAIIKSRLTPVLGEQAAEALYPFDPEALKKRFKKQLTSPRRVIMIANETLKSILFPEQPAEPPPAPMHRLRQAFDRQFQAIRSDFNRYQPDRERLRRALDLYLRHSPAKSPFDLEFLQYPEDRYIDLDCKLRDLPGRFIFIIDVETNNPSVRASLKRGIDFLEGDRLGRVIYLREARNPIPPPPQWKATNEMLERFKKLGGVEISLDAEQTGRWYALALLNYAVKEGDITLGDAETQSRAITPGELAEFIQSDLHHDENSGFGPIQRILRSASPA